MAVTTEKRAALESILTRLAASAQRHRALTDSARAEKELRDGLIVEARDELASWSSISRAAQLSPARCSAIVAGEW